MWTPPRSAHFGQLSFPRAKNLHSNQTCSVQCRPHTKKTRYSPRCGKNVAHLWTFSVVVPCTQKTQQTADARRALPLLSASGRVSSADPGVVCFAAVRRSLDAYVGTKGHPGQTVAKWNTAQHRRQGSTREVRFVGAACNSLDSPCLSVKNSRGEMPCRSRLSRSLTGGSR